MSQPMILVDLLEQTDREGWCVKLGCTTCGATEFRKAFALIPSHEAIDALRDLTASFLQGHRDVFRLMISELRWGSKADLLTALNGTPAGQCLLDDLEYSRQRELKRWAYERSQTPDAIAAHRRRRKEERLQATSHHRTRKAESQLSVQALIEELKGVPDCQLLTYVQDHNFDVPVEAIGGILYERLVSYYRANALSLGERAALSALSERFSGHWSKLLRRLVR